MTVTQQQACALKMPTGTKEWADSNVNFAFGCRNDCRYCYARLMAARFHRRAWGEWATMVVNPVAASKGFTRRRGRVMFPSSHDLFPEHLDIITAILTRLLTAGNQVLITTKPRLEVVKALCKQFEDLAEGIQFRFTIGAMDDALLTFWEPGAPPFAERLEALKFAFDAKFRTSVSIEPFLEFDPIPLIDTVDPFVTESIWLGIMNYIPRNGLVEVELPWYESIRQNYEYDHILALYSVLQNRNKMKFKDSIKKLLGLV